MADKGTKGAYKGVRPSGVDFGAVSEDIVDRFIGQRTAQRKEKALDLSRKAKQDALNQKKYEKTFKDMEELNKLSKDALTLNPLVGAKDVTAIFMGQQKKKYASLMKEFPTADIDRRSEISTEIRAMNGRGVQWNKMTTSLNTLMTETAAGMGTIYDPVLSADWTVNLTKAIQSGVSKGGVELSENSLGWGDYMTIEDVGSGNMDVTYYDTDGNVLTKGNLEDITARVSAGRVPFVDSNKEFTQEFGKGQLADILQEADPYNGLIETSRGTNEKTTKKRLRAQFDERYLGKDANGEYINNFMKKEVAIGSTEKEVRERAVKSAWARMRRESTEMLKANPLLRSRKKEADIQVASDAVAAVLRGDNEAVGNVVANTPWKDPNATIQSPMLKKVSRDGNTVTVDIANTKGESESISYDISNPAEASKIINMVHGGISKDTGVLDANVNEVREKVLQMDLSPKEGSMFARTKEGSFELSKTQLDKADNEKDILNAAFPAVQAIKGEGYVVDESIGNIFSTHKMIVRDKDGKEVDRATGYTDKSFKKEIVKMMDRLSDKKEKEEPAKKEIEKPTGTGGAY